MKILDVLEFFGVDGWLRQSVSLEINGEEVQIIRYDEDNDSIFVKVGELVSEVRDDEISDFVRRRLDIL